ncbi:flagellar hook assembly protein FlgD [Salibacterium salarium]|uniref:Flagellar hook assembly protein FlgD n=1 Tax=Salibacterium salarium TaxID=284579 RepID=A0A428N4J3_9BACI|nr:flagellar hook assembly protein FlgD [Salibacterium salarium]RSL33172.1 flagellar hook assembly protein FlgD [Salibacterium salarium]
MANTIQDNYAIPSQTESLRTDEENGKLGKDDFLKILMEQLQNQDPMNPMDDKQFASQMAQFSSLEQMTNMSQTMEEFSNSQKAGSLVKHSELIGQEVAWERTIENENGTEETEEVTSTIASVRKDGEGNIRLLTDDDRWINSEQLLQVGSVSSGDETQTNDTQD